MNTYPEDATYSRLFLAITIVAVATVLGGCNTPISTDEHAAEFPQYAVMRAELPPLAESATASIPHTRRRYRACTAGVPGTRHEAGWFLFRNERMAAHLFFPASARASASGPTPVTADDQPDPPGPAGTVFLVHGYLSHALDHAALIRRLLREGYLVVAPELPGHGLSGGIRGGIDSFSDYGAFLSVLIDDVGERAPRPWHAIGHSTGAVAILEHLRADGDPFGAIVFAAPLVRNRMYDAARVGRFLTQPLVSTFPTRYDSPLGVPRMPLSWFDAQVAWNAELDSVATIDRPVYVLQGDRDRVVAWRYNRGVIGELFTTVDYDLIPGASHVLFQEEDRDTRQQTLDRTIAYLDRWNETGRRR
jgi:alpha-beta hydrolase superfamily lysophospholipase